MSRCPDRLASSRTRARARLRALQSAATLGGVSLALLTPTASSMPADAANAADAAPTDSVRTAPARRSARLTRPVRRIDAGAREQADPTFASPTSLTGLTDLGYHSTPSVADVDGDGDLDVLAGHGDGTFEYFENTAGAGATPMFASAVINPFGLADIGDYSKPSVADLDGDGDLDVLAGEYYGTFRYFENTAGVGATPVFDPAVINPFGLEGVGFNSTPSVADVDGDGDLDVLAGERYSTFQYFENTAGAGATPAFAFAVSNPFGLAYIGGGYSTPSVADVDGDGDLDVLTGASDGTFGYFENTAGVGSTPTFASAVTNPFGLAYIGTFSAPLVADVDGDGDLDVLAGETGGTFSYFENTTPLPPALFASVVTNPFGLADIGVFVAPLVADVDGDGDSDILAGERFGSFEYLENTAAPGATPAFAAASTNPFGLADIGDFSSPSVADLDGDGDLDVLTTNLQDDVKYFQNTAALGATPAFAAASTDPFGLTGDVRAARMADLDGDGDLDVLAGTSFGTFHYFENTGSSTAPAFASPLINPFGLTDVGSSSAPSVADLDGDGDLDVLSGATDGLFRYFENLAGVGQRPVFAPAHVLPFGLTAVGGGQLVPSVADVDGDGDLDVIASDFVGDVQYFENTSASPPTLFDAPVSTPFALGDVGYFSAPSLADVDSDGDLDVLAGAYNGTFQYFENTGTDAAPTFAAGVSNPFSMTDIGFASAPAMGDLDGDGDLDVVAGNSVGEFRIFFNTAGVGVAPTFAPVFAFGSGDVGRESKPVLGDLDGDGDLDVLVGEENGDFHYIENVSTLGSPTLVLASARINPFGLTDVGEMNTPSLLDLDGDGDLDVIAGALSGAFFYFENTASPGQTPRFAPPQVNRAGLVDIGVRSAPAAGDLDGDGDLDVLTGFSSGTFQFIENTTADAPVAVASGVTNPFGLADVGGVSVPSVADLDGDGDLDVLSGEYVGDFWYFENTAGPGATPVFASVVENPFGLTDLGLYSAPSMADLDGDGDLDVLMVENDLSFRYFENTGTPTAPAFGLAGINPFGLTNMSGLGKPSVADLDGDGDLDVLTGHSDGTFRYFQNTGSSTAPAFASAVTSPFGLADVGDNSTPSVVDMDGDGDLDVLAGTLDGTFEYFENTAGAGATPTFVSATTNPFGLAAIGFSNTPSVADLDGDGDVDVLAGSYNGTFVYFENTESTGQRTATLTGADGWRMLAAPSAGAPFTDVLGDDIWTQGVPGSDLPLASPSVFLYDEAAPGNLDLGYAPPARLDQPLGIGRGAFVYVTDDADLLTTGVQSPFPKRLTAAGRPPLVDFEWAASGADAPLDYTDTGAPADDGWNLLGNPFGSWFDWDTVELANVNAPVYVYNDAVSAYTTYSGGVGSLTGGVIGPFQGFWVQANAASPSVRAVPAVTSGGPLLRDASEAPVVVPLRLRPADDALAMQSEAFVAFGVENATRQLDAQDARALAPPSDAYVLLAAESAEGKDARPMPLSIDARPVPDTEQILELAVGAVASPSAMILDWPEMDLPDGWTVRLIDREAGTETELAIGESYAFTLASSTRHADSTRIAQPRVSGDALTRGRFALRVTPAGVSVGTEDAITEASVSLMMPNPSRTRSMLRVAVPATERVRMTVYDALGREVLRVHDGEVTGAVELAVDATVLAAGAYVVRVEGETFAETRRLTVVR